MANYNANDIAAYQTLMAKEKGKTMSSNKTFTNKKYVDPSQADIEAYNRMMSGK